MEEWRVLKLSNLQVAPAVAACSKVETTLLRAANWPTDWR
jgi:hypothetical protein